MFSLCLLGLMAAATPTANAKSGGSNSTEVSVPVSQIPQRVLTQFASIYHGATNVQWSILPPAYYGSTIYKAKFKFNGAKSTASFF